METKYYDFPMPKSYKDLLLSIIEKSIEGGTLTGDWFCDTNFITTIHIGKYNIEFPDEPGDPFLSFKVMGFIEIEPSGNYVNQFILKPLVFDWYKYQKMTKVGQALANFPENIKSAAIIISFILSIILTIIQIFQK